MSDDCEILFLMCVGGVICFIIGCSLMSSYDHINYNNGVEDASNFYKQYNDTSKDIDNDFWIDYGIYRYPNFYLEFKERFRVD